MSSPFNLKQPSVGRLSFAVLFFLAFSLSVSARSSMQVPAVDANGNGILTTITADVRSGSGGVYVDIEPFISVETQNSAKVAAQQAAIAAGVELGRFDVFYKIKANTEVVDGPSGGQALALLAYSEFSGKALRADMTATGSIEADGSIGRVGGVLEKAEAAQAGGVKLFLVPLGQAVQDGVDLTQHAQARWGMQVVEVRNASESIALAFTPTGSAVDAPLHPEPPLVLQDVSALQSKRVLPLKMLAEDQVGRLRAALSSLDEDGVMAQVVRQAVNRSGQLVQNGYYYSAANEAFLAQIQLDAYRSSNLSKDDLLLQISDLERQMTDFRFSEPTDAGLDWSAGARLRLFWAQERLSDVKLRAQSSTRVAPLLQDFAASRNWFAAAKQLESIAGQQGGNAIPQAVWKTYAAAQVQKANASVSANPLDSESLFHLKAAQRAYAAGDYLAAAYDGAFATAFTEARVELLNVTEERLSSILPQAGRLSDYSGRVWAQAYYAHALFSADQANASGDLLGVINAVKLDGLSQALDRVDGELMKRVGQPVSNEPDEPVPTGGIQVTTTVQPAGPSLWLLFGAAVVLVGLVMLAFVLVQLRSRPGPSNLSRAQRLDLVEEALLSGRISEKTYEKLSRKYEGGAKTRRRR